MAKKRGGLKIFFLWKEGAGFFERWGFREDLQYFLFSSEYYCILRKTSVCAFFK